MSNETKRKMSKSRIGKKHTEETIKLLSIKNKGNKNALGTHHTKSEIGRNNMSKAHKGQIPWNKGMTKIA
jgi:hypothetical protein